MSFFYSMVNICLKNKQINLVAFGFHDFHSNIRLVAWTMSFLRSNNPGNLLNPWRIRTDTHILIRKSICTRSSPWNHANKLSIYCQWSARITMARTFPDSRKCTQRFIVNSESIWRPSMTLSTFYVCQCSFSQELQVCRSYHWMSLAIKIDNWEN